MLELVKYLVTALVDNPDQVKLTESTDETNTTIINLQVAPQDMGRVIGKNGKIISAIRELAKVKAIKQGKKVRLILQEVSS
jgi:predicted RNA-binding protein YlqC (UPF0109 family)